MRADMIARILEAATAAGFTVVVGGPSSVSTPIDVTHGTGVARLIIGDDFAFIASSHGDARRLHDTFGPILYSSEVA